MVVVGVPVLDFRAPRLLRRGTFPSRRTGLWGSSPLLCRFGAETGLSPRRRLRNVQICRNIQVSQAKPAPVDRCERFVDRSDSSSSSVWTQLTHVATLFLA